MGKLQDFNRQAARKFVAKAIGDQRIYHRTIPDEYLESLLKGDQPAALEFIKKFLDSDANECCIAGFPGVGKTFLINCILKEYQGRALLMAPTHKAKIVLQNSAHCKAETFHKVNGLRPNVELDSFKLDNLILSLGGAVTLVEADLAICDEGSMLHADATKLNKMHMKKGAKILYFGDFYQLPPVDKQSRKARLSPIFSLDWYFQMTSVIRQNSDNSLLPLLKCIRTDIDNLTVTVSNTGGQLLANKRNDLRNGEGYASGTLRDVVARSVKMIKLYRGKSEYSSYRMLAYSNPNVQLLNNIIRKEVMMANQIIVDGDFITSYTTIYNEDMQPIIINSMDYLVLNTRLYIDNSGMKCFVVRLSLLDGDSSDYEEVDAVFIDTSDPFTLTTYLDKLEELSIATENCYGSMKSAAYRKLYDFKHSHLVLGKTPGVNKPDFDYGYALTVHKSQGSTYKEVGVYYNELCKVGDPSISKRLVHTAISRAKHRADLIL